jgi:hypothetical protein
MSEESKQGLADAAHPAELLEELECAVKELMKRGCFRVVDLLCSLGP